MAQVAQVAVAARAAVAEAVVAVGICSSRSHTLFAGAHVELPRSRL